MKKTLYSSISLMLVALLFLLAACAPAEVLSTDTSADDTTTPSQDIEPFPSEVEFLDSISSFEYLNLLADIIKVEALNTYIETVYTYKVSYQSDDFEVVGYIAAPLDYLKYKCPVLIYNRGGNQEFGKLSEMEVAGFANLGYVVLASQYRGNDGGTGMEQFGGDEINDVIKLIDISECFEFVQSGGVYMTGLSRGGMMTYIACRMDDRIKAATVGAGISDSFAAYEARDDMKSVYWSLVGGTPEIIPEEYIKRSAVRWADEINTPLLIVHGGEKDWRVDTSQSEDMAAQLAKYDKEYKLIIYEDADHSLQDTGWYLEMIDWFDAHPLN